MPKQNLIDKLFGFSETYGGRTGIDATTLDYAKLISSAKSTVRIVSGKLLDEVWQSPAFREAFKKASSKATIEIIVGHKASASSIEFVRGFGATVTILDSSPSRHFAVIDGRHARIEEPHSEESNKCHQYVIYNYKDASRLEKYFDALNIPTDS